jgi:hypothetical protein
VPVSCKADTHSSSGAADDSSLLALCRMGLDILGPFPRAVGGYRYLYVAIDKFTKWPEATPMVNITKASATAFLRSIVCRFGVPNRVITDNGTQFTSQYFQKYCENIGIQLCFASVAHLRSNSQVEGLTLRSSEGSRSGPTAILRNMVQDGLMSFRACYGGTGPLPAGQQGKPLSSWSTGPKRAFPRRSPWALYESRPLMRTCRNSSAAKTWTLSTSVDGERSGATTNGSCVVGSSGSGT